MWFGEIGGAVESLNCQRFCNLPVLFHRPIKERRKILQKNMTEIPNRILFSEMKHITVRTHHSNRSDFQRTLLSMLDNENFTHMLCFGHGKNLPLDT